VTPRNTPTPSISASAIRGAHRGPLQIVPSLWRVGGDTWNGTTTAVSVEGDANVYLLKGGTSWALVDCGTLAGRGAIEANLRHVGLDPRDVGQLLLTHSHWDHTQSARVWQTTYGLHTSLSAVGARALARGDMRLTGAALHGPDYTLEPFEVDRRVEDRAVIDVAGHRMTAHALPGHTPDSTLYTFGLGGLRAGICGDIVFGLSETGTYSLGLLSALWGSNLDDYVESLRRMESIPIDLLIPGHGDVVCGRHAVRAVVAGTLAVAEHLAADHAVRRNSGF
jgi:metallo-beta-lactamase class B